MIELIETILTYATLPVMIWMAWKLHRVGTVIEDFLYNRTYDYMQEALHEEMAGVPANSTNEQDLWRFLGTLLNDGYTLYSTVKRSGVEIINDKSFQNRVSLRIEQYHDCFHDRRFGKRMVSVFFKEYMQFLIQLRMINQQEKPDMLAIRRLFVVYFRNLVSSLRSGCEKFENPHRTLDKDKLINDLYHSTGKAKTVVSELIQYGLDFETAKILWNNHSRIEEIERKKQTGTRSEGDEQELAKIRQGIHEIIDENI